MKLINEKGNPWGCQKQINRKITPLDFIDIQEKSLFVGISIGSSYHNKKDCVVLMFKDRTKWEMKTNNSEDAFEFLYRKMKFFSENRYKKAINSFLKEYIIITIDACLSTPVKPEYYIRDVELEKKDSYDQINLRWKSESYLKISDWIKRFPISGSSKRIYLETSPYSNFPFDVKENRDIEKESSYLQEACKKIIGLSGSILTIKGWNQEKFKDEYFRDAFVSMLVSIAYSRWKSNDKSGRDDFLKVVVDHDGIYWLLDQELFKKN